ncbi:MAG: ribosomal protein small subunit ribosomal protein [Candidatus Parcubacteria bacterium]|jgi:small subunit ribosomal protein S2
MEVKDIKLEDKTIAELFKAGAHFGFVKSRRHPSAKPFIFGAKNKIEIFDLEKTKGALDTAKAFIKSIAEKKGVVIIVGGKNEAREAVTKIGQDMNMPYVSGRWIGGTLTNFPQIKKRIDKLETLLSQKEKGELSKYTKKERLMIDREIARLTVYFSGLRGLKDVPKALVIIDSKREHIALAEAIFLKIPVVSLSSSDCNLRDVTYPVPANDASKKTIEFFLKEIADAYKSGLIL